MKSLLALFCCAGLLCGCEKENTETAEVKPPTHVQCAGAKVKIGMSRSDVIRLCGMPLRDNGSIVESERDEQLVYGDIDYVYIRDDAVWALDFSADASTGEAKP